MAVQTIKPNKRPIVYNRGNLAVHIYNITKNGGVFLVK